MLDALTGSALVTEVAALTRHQVAVVIDTNATTDALSPAYRALGFVAELLRASDDVSLVFDDRGHASLRSLLGESRPCCSSARWTA